MKTYKTNSHGFTLIEVMIAMLIVTILVAITFPIFQNYELKNRRSQAVNWLSQLRLEMERCASNNNGSYTGCNGAGANLPLALVNPLIQQQYSDLHYGVAITINTINGVVGAGYTLTATETTGDDPDCLTLSVNQLGAKSYTGASPNTIRCWGSN